MDWGTLRGVAILYICAFTEHVREDYTLLKEQLSQRFEVRNPPKIVCRKLGELGQSLQQSLHRRCDIL